MRSMFSCMLRVNNWPSSAESMSRSITTLMRRGVLVESVSSAEWVVCGRYSPMAYTLKIALWRTPAPLSTSGTPATVAFSAKLTPATSRAVAGVAAHSHRLHSSAASRGERAVERRRG